MPLLLACSEAHDALFDLVPSSHSGINFKNQITESAEFNVLTEEYIFNGGGVAIADFNRDGLKDIFFAGNQVSNQLYLNKGNLQFKEVSMEAAVSAYDRWCTAVSITDINADGWPDIYVCAAMSENPLKRKNLLFVHSGLNENGIPIFKEMAENYGVADMGNAMGSVFFDYDKDGLLDLYIVNNEQLKSLPTNYRPKIVDGSAKGNDRLYKNNGNGTFSD
ncbi:MAG: FG-GAP repeat domain-containing protein, partial [Flavobacteriaceae bacterium]